MNWNWVGLYSLIRREVARIFRVAIQTLATPLITALLYIFIFGSVIGSRIDLISGVPYIIFVLPGILMMNVILSAFTHSSSSLYFKRFVRDIEELLVAPLSYTEMVIGFVTAAIVRSVLVGLGIFVIAIFFGGASIAHFGQFLFYIISVGIVFSLLGILVGLWAKGFDQLNVLNAFIITPLSFLGGVFYSISMLPEKLQAIALYNPFFYFIDGIRFSMIGIREGSALLGYVMIFGLILGLGTLVVYLFRIGWHIKT